MKAISLQAIITSISSKVDKSLGLRVSTPELTSVERLEIMDLQGLNIKLLIEPTDVEVTGHINVENTIETKTQSQRIRAIIFLLWKQDGEQGRFENYYREKTEKYIEFLKEKLET